MFPKKMNSTMKSIARVKLRVRYSFRMSLMPDTVRLPSTSALGRAEKLSSTRIMSETPRAAPAPDWSEMPTWAVLRDLTSLTPSPIMAT